MKKVLITITIIVSSILSALAYDCQVDGIYYNLNKTDKTASLTYRNKEQASYKKSNITIPQEITFKKSSYKVTSIGDSAFYNCESLKSITIPNSITAIGIEAFYLCKSLSSINIPNSVTAIGDNVFYGCSSITSITIPNSVKSIGIGAFQYCKSLATINLSNSVTSIANDTFYGCSSLMHITIPSSVTSIGDNAFYGCSSLSSITIPNSVTSIGEIAFASCTSLTSLIIPNSVTYIGAFVFNKCKSLKSVTLPNTITTIDKYVFASCESLKTITIPNSVTSIGEGAFQLCESLASITIPNSVTAIGNSAFFGCKSLLSIIIPNLVTSIDEDTFVYCTSLTSIIIPSSVTSIGKSAFESCESLTSVTIPNSVISIGEDAFKDSGIKEIVISPTLKNLIPAEYAGFVRYDSTVEPATVNLAATSIPTGNTGNGDDIGSGSNSEAGGNDASSVSASVVPASATPTTTAVGKKSDVDVSIPLVSGTAANTFALVIANENYRREGSVAYAQNDGEIFAEYLKSTLGLPDKNVQLFVDASLNDIKYGLNKLRKICDAFDGDAKVIVYYAGHGIPDDSSRDAYLLPVDGFGSDVTTGYSLKELYETLGSMPSRQTLLLMDACFSGAQRDGSMMASNARAVRIKPKENQASGNLIVISATQGDETAYPYEEQQHGMFTYFLLKKLKEDKGNLTLGDLADYIITNVKRTSILDNDRLQTPTVSVSPVLSTSWKSLKLAE